MLTDRELDEYRDRKREAWIPKDQREPIPRKPDPSED